MTPGQASYEAYCEKAGGVSLVSGDTLPGWDLLHPDVREAWESAAQAAVRSGTENGVEYRSS